MKKKITLEKFAGMVQDEFSALHKRDQLLAESIRNLTKITQTLAETTDLMRADIHDIKITLPPLIRGQAALEGEVGELKNRVARLERKVGLPR